MDGDDVSIQNVKVSVMMVTYNHRDFIAQAIESVLMQRTTFDFELVIGEDCSTDGTRDIVMNFQSRYPDRVRAQFRGENLGMMGNFIQTYKDCRGEYVALLDGDDYWTSPDKLQIQTAYLDSHVDCAMCFHATTVEYEDSNRRPHDSFPAGRRSTYGIEDLLPSNIMHTSSVMFRHFLFSEFPDWFMTMSMGDWPLHILNAQYGKIGYVDQVMSTYRVHLGGVWSRLEKTQRLQNEIDAYDVINRHLKFRYNRTIKAMIARRYYRMAIEYAKRGELTQARSCALRSITTSPLNQRVTKSEMAGLLLFLFAHPVYRLTRVLRTSTPSAISGSAADR
jgi:glycosyltransferase involved in cell wall biosynthesis